MAIAAYLDRKLTQSRPPQQQGDDPTAFSNIVAGSSDLDDRLSSLFRSTTVAAILTSAGVSPSYVSWFAQLCSGPPLTSTPPARAGTQVSAPQTDGVAGQ